jgi:hypothetical protein
MFPIKSAALVLSLVHVSGLFELGIFRNFAVGKL